MVVNGRQELVGSDAAALADALAHQPLASSISLHIDQVSHAANIITVHFTARTPTPGTPTPGSPSPGTSPPGTSAQNTPLDLMAALVDDADHSSVAHGENAGRALDHVFVARALMLVGPLHPGAGQSIQFAVPPSLLAATQPRHIILFAQAKHLGPVFGATLAPFAP